MLSGSTLFFNTLASSVIVVDASVQKFLLELVGEFQFVKRFSNYSFGVLNLKFKYCFRACNIMNETAAQKIYSKNCSN